jgi:hypothetical protein
MATALSKLPFNRSAAPDAERSLAQLGEPAAEEAS